jgi:hypothetical protein
MSDMKAVSALVKQFISGSISATDFKRMYLQVWREIRDEQHFSETKQPELIDERNKLEQKRLRGQISAEDFAVASRQLNQALYEGCRVQPFTKEAEHMDRLFNAVELYSPPESRDEQHTGEKELLETVIQLAREFKI